MYFMTTSTSIIGKMDKLPHYRLFLHNSSTPSMKHASLEKVNIGGTHICNVSLEETLEIFSEAIENHVKKRVCVIPVNCIVWAAENKALQEIYNTADLSLCDGVPILWMSKLLGTPLKGRVTGLDLLPLFTEICAQKSYSVFLLGAKPGVGNQLAEKFQKTYPNLHICGLYTPPMAASFSAEENQHMVDLINAAAPDIVWVSLSAPKQDYWIAEHFDKLNATIVIGVGGAFEVSAGLIARAPKWMQQNGLEWLFRFTQEPKRLFHRYFIEAPRIVWIIVKQLLSRKDNQV